MAKREQDRTSSTKSNERLTCEQRLKNLSAEFALASAQVLMAEYGFSQDQAKDFLAMATAQAKKNRTNLETIGTVQALEKALLTERKQ